MRFSKNALQRSVRSSGTKPSAPTATDPSVCTILSLFSIILVSSFLISYHITSYFLDPSSYLNEDDPEDWYDGDDPANWERFTMREMGRHFECDKAFASTRPWWTNDQWREVRDLYRDFAQVNRPSNSWWRKARTGTYQHGQDTLFDSSQNAVPYQTENKGRGLKAARDIREGEIIFETTNNTVVFNDAHTFRKFLFALNERFPTFACDVLMMWAWVQDLDREGTTFGVVCDLNDNNLLNNAGEEEDANVRCGGEEDICGVTSGTFYAVRDIDKGEEILGWYGDFVSYHPWAELGL